MSLRNLYLHVFSSSMLKYHKEINMWFSNCKESKVNRPKIYFFSHYYSRRLQREKYGESYLSWNSNKTKDIHAARLTTVVGDHTTKCLLNSNLINLF